jgi:hypothetical protein
VVDGGVEERGRHAVREEVLIFKNSVVYFFEDDVVF